MNGESIVYQVNCLKCKGFNKAIIRPAGGDRFLIDLDTDHKQSKPYIISARYRADMQFGWECICGNDNRVSRKEADQVESLVVNGGRKAIEDIVRGLAIEDEKKFRMERIK
jgi:hypothetical protein